MGRGRRGAFGDVVGFGARRFVLRLAGAKAPYRRAAALSTADFIEPSWRRGGGRPARRRPPTNGGRAGPDRQPGHQGGPPEEGAPLRLPPALVLGAELFYLHDTCY